MRSLSEEVFVSKQTAMGAEARYVNCILDFVLQDGQVMSSCSQSKVKSL